jgi:hypothetical protein
MLLLQQQVASGCGTIMGRCQGVPGGSESALTQMWTADATSTLSQAQLLEPAASFRDWHLPIRTQQEMLMVQTRNINFGKDRLFRGCLLLDCRWRCAAKEVVQLQGHA